MAYFNTTNTQQNTFFSGLSHAVSALALRWKQHRQYRETLNGLSALSDRELADLGLSRGELHAVAHDAVVTNVR